jgi:NADPH:quinone reductase-like Zn-dependent oxidoreductase
MGTFAVQIARYYGAEATGVDGSRRLEMLRWIGADHLIDYAQTDYTRSGQRYDVILDVVTHRSVFDYQRALTPKGVFIIIGGSLATFLQVVFPGAFISRRGGKKLGMNAYDPSNREDLVILEELFQAGKVVPVIDRRYPLSAVPEALRHLEEGSALGKVVITVGG